MSNNDMPFNDIEVSFLASWNYLDNFYRFHQGPLRTDRMLYFIEQLRLRDYYKRLRAGTSMERLLLSRSFEYGLRSDQHFIVIEFVEPFEEGQLVVKYYEGARPYNDYSAQALLLLTDELTPAIEVLLERLCEQEIN